MLSISTWLETLGVMGRVFLYMAIPATVILLIQIVMSLIGMGDDGDVDTDLPDNGIDGVFGSDTPDTAPDLDAAEGGALRLLSLRSIIAFFVTVGWMGVVLTGTLPPAGVITVSLACGVFVMALVAFLMRAVYRLQSDGTTDLRRAVGKCGTVYLTVPAKRAGVGKVNLLLQDSYIERGAVTDDETPLPYGTEVLVLGVTGGNTLVVTKK
ncbi:MAG: hypothetical protein J6125_04680 [Clostridia bacterium]|nr:hypothetical protein [Clostridia bacterium]